jgi:hypothetical protein
VTDPIYFTDDYPRTGCVVSIDVQADGYAMRIAAPGGKVIESYAKVKTPRAIGRVVEEWCAGMKPRLRDPLDQSPGGEAA